MSRSPLIKLSFISALAMPVLWLLASGCSSIDLTSPERPAIASTAQVLSTNPVPIEVEDDHVLVRGALNGREVRLLLDTGASFVTVSPAVAGMVGLRKTRKAQFGAFGDERGSARLGIAESVVVGPAVAEKVPIFIMPIPPVFHADGFLGVSFLRQFAFRLDYQQELLSFAPPGNSTFAGVGSSVSMQEDGRLTIQAQVDGAPARLVVDTGAGQGLILQSWFVEEQKLRERYPKRLNVVTGGSLLGLMRGEITRLQALKLGDYTLTNVFVEFSAITNARRGNIAGYVGAGVLRRFNLAFDLAGRCLRIEPNANYLIEAPPPASVRSGLVCLPDGESWVMRDLLPDSPAAEAGVRLGDRLLEVNGLSTQSLRLEEIKRAFQAEPGTRVRLRLQAPGETPREVVLILRDLL